MSRGNVSFFHRTLIGIAPHIRSGVVESRPASAEIVRVSAELGRRRRIVVTEQTKLGAADAKCVLLHRPGSPQARSYRVLRHRLLGNTDPRVVVVTSAQPAEGKTTCAINLALAIAEDTMVRVLLVETNSIRPSFAETFDLRLSSSSNAWNVAPVNGAGPIAVATIAWTRLDVAASRRGPLGLDRLLFGVAMRDLRDAYDYVIIDAGAVFESADANVASECADGVIVTALATKSRRAHLKRTIDQLRPAPILGVVLLDT